MTVDSVHSARLSMSCAVAAACLLALTACSVPLADNGPTGSTGPGGGTGAGAGTVSGAPSDEAARRFVACLVGRGLDARTAPAVGAQGGQASGSAVELRMIDQSGNPVSSSGTTAGASSSSGSPDPYANAAYVSMEDGANWVVFKDAESLAGSPYESRRQDYADCEAQNPDFTQPVPDNGQPVIPEADRQAALDYAKAARDKGFSWVADPDAANPTTIMVPVTVSEDEFRRLLKEVPNTSGVVSFGFSGDASDYGWDYNEVLGEF